jgi:hypothetical protein
LLYLCFLVKLMNDNIIFFVGNQCEICGWGWIFLNWISR